jgi:hypothetical protein
MAIKSIEWLGMYEAKALIVKSEWMRDEAVRLYKVLAGKIRIISPDSKSWIEDTLETYKIVAGDGSSR